MKNFQSVVFPPFCQKHIWELNISIANSFACCIVSIYILIIRPSIFSLHCCKIQHHGGHDQCIYLYSSRMCNFMWSTFAASPCTHTSFSPGSGCIQYSKRTLHASRDDNSLEYVSWIQRGERHRQDTPANYWSSWIQAAKSTGHLSVAVCHEYGRTAIEQTTGTMTSLLQ